MGKLEISSGEKYGKLTIVKEVRPHIQHPSGEKRRKFLCKCECGNFTEVVLFALRGGNTKSCGCINAKRLYKHGLSNTRVYSIWEGVIDRITNENCRAYKHYGGRGINCLWTTFEEFYKDMGLPPTTKHTLDRIDNNKGYYKENCRWATQKQQMNNTRSNIIISINGEANTLMQWCEQITKFKDTKKTYNRIHTRIYKGMDKTEALIIDKKYNE